jgi:hypothetical protein
MKMIEGTEFAKTTTKSGVPIIGATDDSEVVTLWRAATKESVPFIETEVANGIDPSKYKHPKWHPYYATDTTIALDFQGEYGAGMIEIALPRTVFEDLVDRGVLTIDALYTEGRSWSVPRAKIEEFNKVATQYTVYHK